MIKHTLIIGGSRSGKSQYAENLAALYKQKTYIATAQILDAEMQERINLHKARRDRDWTTIEVPIDLSNAINTINSDTSTTKACQQPKVIDNESIILIDCISLWLTNLILANLDIEKETANLLNTLKNTKHHVIMVTNEVGMSIVPENILARQFRDEQGKLNQTLAAFCSNVALITAGLPLILKDETNDK